MSTEPARLAIAHARAHAGRTCILILCVALAAAVPVATRVAVARFERSLNATTQRVPWVIGEKGSRFDLVFAAAHLRPQTDSTVPWRVFEDQLNEGHAAVPMTVRDTAGGVPIVGVSVEYFERLGLRVERGEPVRRLGEVVAGAHAGYQPGDTVRTDQRRSFDITGPSSAELTVLGVLAPTGGPEDRVLFMDVQTAWILEGIAHAHEDAAQLADEGRAMGRTETHVGLNPGVQTAQRITPDNAAAFHVHGDRGELPLTAILLFDLDQKASTVLGSRLRQNTTYQLVSPPAVADELLTAVVRIRSVLDAVALVAGVSTGLLIATVAALAYRTRKPELVTLREIGVSRGAIACMVLGELALVVAAGVTLGVGAAWLATPWFVELTPWVVS